MASIGKSLQVLFPVDILLFSQLVEVIPTENTGAMLVVKLQAHGIVSDRLNGKNIDIFFACLQLPDDSRKNVSWSCS